MSNFDAFLTRMCCQTAVYWGNPQDDGYGGKTYDDPVEIACRWEDYTEVRRELNETFTCRARVHVLQDLDERGRLYLGTLDDLDSADEENPETVNGAYEIKRFEKIPAVGSTTRFLRRALLHYGV